MIRKIEYLVTAILLALIIILGISNKKKASENKALKSNVSTLIEGVEQYTIQDSLQVATIADLELSLSQYKKYMEEDEKLIHSLKIDNKRLRGVISTQTESYYKHTAVLRDSVKMLSTGDSVPTPIHIKTASYSDRWHSLNVTIEGDSLDYILKTKESLLITNHIVPKRFLFIKYGCKEVRTDVVSKSPYAEDINVESITIR
jgi:hypothetical protein